MCWCHPVERLSIKMRNIPVVTRSNVSNDYSNVCLQGCSYDRPRLYRAYGESGQQKPYRAINRAFIIQYASDPERYLLREFRTDGHATLHNLS
jgi:hypothetical protein